MSRKYAKYTTGLAPIIILYWIAGIALLNYYQYQINPDGVSYISIAEKYLNGDLSNAINGYWGPLFSWLLIPFLLLNLPTVIAVKLLSLTIGLFTIIGIKRLSYRFEITEKYRSMVIVLSVPIVLYFALSVITPDLLLTCLLIFYLDVIFDSNYFQHSSRGILCGVIAVLAYLSKSYAFPFFIIHFLILNLLHYLRCKEKVQRTVVWQNCLLGFLVFFILSSFWIYCLYNKYGKLTISTAGKYNHAIVAPDIPGLFPVQYLGLLKPPNQTAASIWEDPSYIEIKPWNPFSSSDAFLHQLRLILESSYRTLIILESFSFLSILIILLYLYDLFRPFNSSIIRSTKLYPLLTLLIYTAGLTIFHMEERYLWINDILLLLICGQLVNYFSYTGKESLMIYLIALSFLLFPIKKLAQDINNGKDIYILSQTLASKYKIYGNVASSRYWNTSFHISYYLGSKYYGVPRKGVSDSEMLEELKRNNIDYYFVVNETANYAPVLSRYKEITNGEMVGLRIYALKE
ncbi:MAG: hypothetical protein AB1489_30275 [Acidobacteriota bacterium]